jgi:ABC-type Fe3+/spermidine/putrescine transport system ATPase subunit
MTLEVAALAKSFGTYEAVRRISFTLEEGQVLSLLGPSGCGKTTTLRMIAGFEHPNGGTIVLDGRDITGVPARKRNIGMVFQSYALFPHLTAAGNVAFGLEMRDVGRAEREERVKRALDMVRMNGFGDRMPKSLSGGQQQRVALARALVIEPDLLLLDEPLSALDLKLREEMRDEIYRIVRELRITTIFVTHDQGEALVLSDQVAVMNQGRIDQIGSPREVYLVPRTAFVARFIGGANVISGKANGHDAFITEYGFPILIANMREGASAVSIRPEDIGLDKPGNGPRAVVTRARFLGDMYEYTLDAGGGRVLTVRTGNRQVHAEGSTVGLLFNPERFVFLDE